MEQENNSRRNFLLTGLATAGLALAGCASKTDPFEAGAKEVWLCDENGVMQFFNAEQELTRSELVSEFPEKISV